ncbi:helix-turn-helix domain-containing protein [Bacillus sp. PR5]|nr:helix-turn-helix domain-containing protein [Bacillus sp. PR5]
MATVLRIKAIAADRGILLSDLAKTVGLSINHFSMVTRNRRKTVRLELIGKLCAALDCTPNELIDIRADTEKPD